MKRKFIICLIAAFSFVSTDFAISQCNPNELLDNCPANIPNGFTFVKSYELNAINSSTKRIEKSYVFSKDMTYSLAMCKGDPNVIVKIFDSSRKEVATNFYENKFLPTFGFRCGATGIYYMAFSFDQSAKDCAAAVLAFKK
ncbi:MAG TPA: hypothetical protein VD908_07215 [Cytophagales bacterium]|nr:hypothetical protein [Cytophagales bacterium]